MALPLPTPATVELQAGASVPGLVTIVIPCFNQGRYLPDALRSIRNQRYHSLETIVVDDGSTDGSSEIARQPQVTVIRQPNMGLGSARNAGLAAARGEFVVFLDADDELLAEAVSSGVATLQARPDLSCVVRQCQVMDADRRALMATRPSLDTADLYRQWLRHNFVWTPGAAVFRRDRIAAVGGFPNEVGPAADYAVYLTLSRRGEIAFEGRDAVRYRQHDSNMSRDPVLMLRATLAVLCRERQLVPPGYREDFEAGLRSWRAYYGEQIVERLRRDWRAGILGPWQRAAVWVLLRHCPRVVATHLLRKLSRIIRGITPGPIEPGRYEPDVSSSAEHGPPSG